MANETLELLSYTEHPSTAISLSSPPLLSAPSLLLHSPLSLLSTLVEPKLAEFVEKYFIVSVDMTSLMGGTRRCECTFCDFF